MSADAQKKRIIELHKKRFGVTPTVVAHAPGRVEILGNHTDYNEGLALSAAIDCGVWAVFSIADSQPIHLYAADLDQEETFVSNDPSSHTKKPWSRLIEGVLQEMPINIRKCPPFTMTVGGNLPVGAGLGSSAALEILVSTIFRRFLSLDISRQELCRICQRAEANFAGVQCGLLDQMSILFAVDHALLQLDFRSEETHPIVMSDKAVFIFCNTSARHTLAVSAYNERRSQCAEATAAFAKALPHPVKSLRDVSLDEWLSLRPMLDPVLAKRAMHVISENERVRRAESMIRSAAFKELGDLLYASHQSSINNFENSCPELDFVVEQARATHGVWGARLTGGGFGGSVVVLAHAADAHAVMEELELAYQQKYQMILETRIVHPSAGARLLRS